MKKATGISYAERAKQYSKDVGRQLHADNGELSLLNALQCVVRSHERRFDGLMSRGKYLR